MNDNVACIDVDEKEDATKCPSDPIPCHAMP
jgi:hypothetical protein